MVESSQQATPGASPDIPLARPGHGGLLRGLLRFAGAILAFALACLVAGMTQVAFATSLPAIPDLLGPDWIERVGPTVALVLFATALSALFAAPFALVAILFARWRGVGGGLYYALVGMVIAVGGFVALRAAELPGEATIINPYALAAYLVSGLLGGLTYWALAGRGADGSA